MVLELERELGVVRPGVPAIQPAIAALRELTALESIVLTCPVARLAGWSVERFEAAGLPNATRFRRATVEFLAGAPPRFGWFDPRCPEPAQRNVVIDLRRRVPDDELVALPVHAGLLVPMGLHRHHLVRALICEGASLLAWFGAFHPERTTPRQRALLGALVPALGRRLAFERRLAVTTIEHAAHGAVLESLDAPAFVLGAAGQIVEANGPGQRMLARQRDEVASSLRAAMARERGALAFEVCRLATRGAAPSWLAISRPRTQRARIAETVRRGARRLGLTRRQVEVVEGVVQGRSNAQLAADLAVTERAIEQHLSRVFARAGVAGRAALVALILRGGG